MTVIVDSSAWIAYLRDLGDVADRLEQGLVSNELATTDPVIMEVLAGARSPVEEDQLAASLAAVQRIACERADYVEAARIHRACRAGGVAVRSMVDCLIAAVAIRTGASLLHADRDFEKIARCSTLELA